MRVKDGGIQLLDGLGAICIGMMLGYHLSASTEDEIIVPTLQQSASDEQKSEDSKSDKLSLDERNTGFAVVLQFDDFDVMESEAMKRSMDQAIDRPAGGTRVRPAGLPIAPKSRVSSDDDANPSHLEDFTRLVDVAARKRPQGDQT